MNKMCHSVTFSVKPKTSRAGWSIVQKCAIMCTWRRSRTISREWRKYRDLTQERLADRIGITRSYLTKIERGDRRYDQPF